MGERIRKRFGISANVIMNMFPGDKASHDESPCCDWRLHIFSPRNGFESISDIYHMSMRKPPSGFIPDPNVCPLLHWESTRCLGEASRGDNDSVSLSIHTGIPALLDLQEMRIRLHHKRFHVYFLGRPQISLIASPGLGLGQSHKLVESSRIAFWILEFVRW